MKSGRKRRKLIFRIAALAVILAIVVTLAVAVIRTRDDLTVGNII